MWSFEHSSMGPDKVKKHSSRSQIWPPSPAVSQAGGAWCTEMWLLATACVLVPATSTIRQHHALKLIHGVANISFKIYLTWSENAGGAY